MSFDALDYHINSGIHQDGRLPATELARLVGADVRTVRNRITRLVKRAPSASPLSPTRKPSATQPPPTSS